LSVDRANIGFKC